MTTEKAVAKSNPITAAKPTNQFPICGIGASAGGLEAFSQLLASLSCESGMAFVLIQHLDPSRESSLAKILAKVTKMPVREAADGMLAEPNCVYVISAKTDITIAEGHLQLLERKTTANHLPIDIFFRALADTRGSQAVGIVLSGTGSDGVAGLREIRAKGGITFAQDPKSARFDSMPRSAIATECVDFVLSPQEIAQELLRMAKHPYLRQAPAETIPVENAGEDRVAMKGILDILRARKGVDFSSYKENTIQRRVHRRMLSNRIDSLATYLSFLIEHETEAEALYNDILIKVTHFFRDPATFDVLKKTVFPQILSKKAPDAPIRIWVPGCSTGEEAYSYAMCLLEFLGEKESNVPIQIFGTDISDEALEKARMGSYLDNISHDVSPERLCRFFSRYNGRYVVNKSVRDLCVFAKQNLLKDPPFSRLDLISCRNLLIYLGLDLQRKIMPIFHFALNPHGFLLLGSAETTNSAPDIFTALDNKHRLFSKNPNAQNVVLDFPGGPALREQKRTVPTSLVQAVTSRTNLQREANRLLTSRYAPVGVVINSRFEILQFIGDTGPYLQNSEGQANLDLLRMARKGLQPDLGDMLKDAREMGGVATRTGVIVDHDGEKTPVDLEAIPVPTLPSEGSFWAVTFKKSAATPVMAGRRRAGKSKGDTVPDVDAVWKKEMNATRAHLEAVISEKDTAFEELQTANEEILSNNEELQSINEEVQTAQEELQSTNEELSTVNDELHHANLQAGQLVSDLNNLLDSVNIPIVIVDFELNIRRFTSRAQKMLHFIPADVGRPLADVNMHLSIADLKSLVLEVVPHRAPAEKEMKSADGHWFLVRVRPTLEANGRCNGAVLIFVDVDAMKRTEEEIVSALDVANSTLATIREPLVVLNSEFRIEQVSPSFYLMFGGSPEHLENRFFFDIGGGCWNIPRLREKLEAIVFSSTSFHDLEIEQEFEAIGRRTFMLNAAKVRPNAKGADLILLAIEDITDRKRAETQLIRTNQDLADFAHIVAHDLQAPLHRITSFTDLLMKEIELPQPNHSGDYIERIRTNGLKMGNLMKSLLDYAKSTAPGEKFQDDVDVGLLVSQLLGELQDEISRTGAKIAVDNLPLVRANGSQISQLLTNLIENALKYRREMPPEIGVTARHDGDAWLFGISDNGVGVAPQHQKKIFELFQRARTTERPGSGIGLMICKKIVENHGGRIWVESTPGQGSTFYFTLPFIPPKRL